LGDDPATNVRPPVPLKMNNRIEPPLPVQAGGVGWGWVMAIDIRF
jgi:hypothetical protein